MNIVVFSKDRPLQLELFIRSFNKYVKDSDNYIINVLYNYSNNNYKNGYDKLISMNYSNVNYIKEDNFRTNLMSINYNKNEYTVFFVDDNIFVNYIDFNDEQSNIFKSNNNILCRSLRLNPNLTYCYTEDRHMDKPYFINHNIFHWRGQIGDFGYPMSLDGHIFRTRDILPYIINLNYFNPNSLECEMSIRPINLPMMICYDKSIIINNPCNKVQNFNNNKHGNTNTEELNSKFLDGYIISMENTDGLQNISCHQEIEIILKKE